MSNVTPAKTNVLAIVGMVLSLAGLVLLLTVGWGIWGGPGALSIAGVVCSHIAMKQVAARKEGGRPLAITGIITGYVGILFLVIQIIIGIVALIFISAVVSGVSSLVTSLPTVMPS
jgi:hypothetical protein